MEQIFNNQEVNAEDEQYPLALRAPTCIPGWLPEDRQFIQQNLWPDYKRIRGISTNADGTPDIEPRESIS